MIGLAPLNALRAFEASARRGGFAAAAEELHVTPAAVGQQVRQLEVLIGAQLFDRVGRQLILTERGAAALAPLQRGFELLGEASATMRDPGKTSMITIAAPRDLLSTWVAADLASWTGDADLRVVEFPKSVDPSVVFDTGADIAIAYSPTSNQGANRLMRETLTPLASPSLTLIGDGFERLTHVPLIEDGSLATGWVQWAAARGVYGADLSPAVRAPDSVTALALAKAGAGILLARKPLALDAISRGELTAILPDGDLAVSYGYDLIEAPGARANAKIADLIAHFGRRAAMRLDSAGEL